MTEDDLMTKRVNLNLHADSAFDDMLDVANDMAKKLEDVREARYLASGDAQDCAFLDELLGRWNDAYARWLCAVTEDDQ
jgi:hypothetical protein